MTQPLGDLPGEMDSSSGMSSGRWPEAARDVEPDDVEPVVREGFEGAELSLLHRLLHGLAGSGQHSDVDLLWTRGRLAAVLTLLQHPEQLRLGAPGAVGDFVQSSNVPPVGQLKRPGRFGVGAGWRANRVTRQLDSATIRITTQLVRVKLQLAQAN